MLSSIRSSTQRIWMNTQGFTGFIYFSIEENNLKFFHLLSHLLSGEIYCFAELASCKGKSFRIFFNFSFLLAFRFFRHFLSGHYCSELSLYQLKTGSKYTRELKWSFFDRSVRASTVKKFHPKKQPKKVQRFRSSKRIWTVLEVNSWIEKISDEIRLLCVFVYFLF